MPSTGPPPLRRLVVPGLFVAALFAVYFLRQGPETPSQRELLISGSTMGTTYTVKVVTDDASDANGDRIGAIVHQAVDLVDHTMSTYRSDSEVSAFNRGGSEPFEASPPLIEVVTEARRIARISGGAFDITVGPLVDLWGFGPSGGTTSPTEEELRPLLEVTGFERIEVDPEHRTLRKERPEIRIDLSAIAKGYAVDRVSTALDAAGLTNHMVEIGGEVRTRGVNGAGTTWTIGIERPIETGRALQTAVALTDASLATSGDYRNFIERDGVRLSHTIDPRTGRPVDHGLASVSVIQESCMSADALATALEVLGPDEGHRLAERLRVPALFLVRKTNGDFEQRQTSAWSELTEKSSDGSLR